MQYEPFYRILKISGRGLYSVLKERIKMQLELFTLDHPISWNPPTTTNEEGATKPI